jgi:hypothetical protein
MNMRKKVCFVIALGVVSTSSFASSWKVLPFEEDPMSESNSYYASSPSTAPMKKLGFPYSDAKSWVGVGCDTDKNYWAYVGFNKANFSGGDWVNSRKRHYTKIKYDNEIKSIQLIEAKSGKEFLHVAGLHEDNFISGLKKSNTIITGVPWYKQGDVWFKYSMRGSTKAINTIFSKCGIKTKW